MYTRQEIEKWFTHGPHTEAQGAAIKAVHDGARATALLILETLPEGPEKKLALDRLQEAVMWANTSVSRNATQPS